MAHQYPDELHEALLAGYLLPSRITLLVTTPSVRTPEERRAHEAFLRNAHKPALWQAHLFEPEDYAAYLQSQ